MRYAQKSRRGGRRVNAIVQAVQGLHAESPQRDFVVISSPITRDLHGQLSGLLRDHQEHSSATVFLTTYGGDPDGGYRIARCLRHHYGDGLRVVVPSWCKSAGTLVAIAADELGIGDRGELGPLDVQVFKGSELQERSSGLDITEALGVIGNHVRWGYHGMLREARQMGLSTKLAAEMAAHIGAAIAAPLLNQVDPMRLGELQRATRIAWDYGTRLDQYSQNLKEGALQALIHGYPSHSFVIDRKEACSLFKRVSPLTQAERQFVDAAWHAVETQTGDEPVILERAAPTTHGEQDENSVSENSSEGRNPQAAGAGAGDHGDSESGPEGVRVRARRNGKAPSGRAHEPASGSDSPENVLKVVSVRK